MQTESFYRDGIAIIGQAVHCAGNTRSPEDLHALLMSCRDVSQRVPCTRFSADAFGGDSSDRRGKTDAPFGYFCEDISRFDTSPGLFGMSPNECKHVDPQQRQLLLMTAEAIENAGLSLGDVFNTNTGVYIGNMNRDYLMLLNDTQVINQFSSQGSASAIAANRISFTFNFRGISIAIDSACSATGIGIHFAANDLRCGNIDMAVVGGFNLIMTPFNYIGLSQLQVLSKIGKTLAFDESADGYTRGEGGGVLLLKRYEDAVRDGNNILGVIATTATCSNGRSMGAMAAPSSDGQLDMFRRTFSLAKSKGILPCDVQYIECHGTGTHRGDSVEMNACGEFLFKVTPADERPPAVYIGSVKANVGHLEAGACIPSVVKVLKCFEHKTIPKQINYHHQNKELKSDFVEKLRIPTEHTAWLAPTSGKPRMAVINSYGYGGSIAQLILVEYIPPLQAVPPVLNVPGALIIWGHTKAAVQQRKQKHKNALSTTSSTLHEYCAGASSLSNNNGGFHSIVIGSTIEQLLDRVDSSAIVPVAHKSQTLALVFPGQGSQTNVPQYFFEIVSYREVLLKVEDWLQRTSKPYTMLTSSYRQSWPLSMQGLFIFAHEAAFVGLLTAAVPQLKQEMPMLVGHSLGEYAVALLRGELTLIQCCEAIWGIGEALEPLRGSGFMAEASLTNTKALRDVDIACVNSPDRVVVSGSTAAMEAAILAGATKISNVDFPFHSAVMDQRKDVVLNLLKRLSLNCERWWENIRGCVKFTTMLDALAKKPVLFLEVGLQTSLSPAVVRTTGIDSVCASQHLVKTLGMLRQHGYRIVWKSVYGKQRLARESLVPLPLHLEHHWFETIASFRSRMGVPCEFGHPQPIGSVLQHFKQVDIVKKPEDTAALAVEGVLNSSTFMLLSDHVYNKASLVPGTFWIELLHSLATCIVPRTLAVSRLTNIEFTSACFTPPQQDVTIRVLLSCRDEHSFDATIQFRLDSSVFATCAKGVIEFHPPRESNDVDAVAKYFAKEYETGAVVYREEWYEIFKAVNFDFGPRFQLLDVQRVLSVRENISSVLGGGTVKDRVRVELLLNSDCESDYSEWPFVVHPGIIDAATQGMAVKRADGSISSSLPWKVGEVLHFTEFERNRQYVAFLEVLHSSSDVEMAHCIIGTWQDEQFYPVMLLRNFTCKVIESNVQDSDDKTPSYFEMTFAEQELIDKSKVIDADVLIVLLPLEGFSVPTDLVLSVASRLQRSTVVQLSADGSLPQHATNKGSQSLRVCIFLPSPNVVDDPVAPALVLVKAVLHVVHAVEKLQQGAQNVFLSIFTDVACLSSSKQGLQEVVFRSVVGSFRAIVVEHGEMRPKFVEYEHATENVATLCDEIKFGWDQPKLESHVILGSTRRVGVYEKIRSPLSVATANSIAELSSGSWFIAGGCGAMGLLLAKYLVGIGCQKVFLASRRGVAERDKAEYEQLPKGIVEVLLVDVTDYENLSKVVLSLQPAVRHVINLAMVLHDKFIRSVTDEDISLVGNPKILGTWNLHKVESELPRPYHTFVVTSSTTSLVGTPGQFAYGSANSFMDGLISFRRSKGLRGTALQLGPVADIGVLAREEGAAAKSLLERSGWRPHSADMLLAIFTDVLLRSEQFPSVISPLQIAANYFHPEHRTWRSYDRLVQYYATEEKRVSHATMDEALAVVKRILAQELRYSEESIHAETSLNNLGVTSMVQNILAMAVQENFSGVSIPQRFFLAPEVTPLAIAKEIIERLSKLANADADASGVEVSVASVTTLIWSAGSNLTEAISIGKRLLSLFSTAANPASSIPRVLEECAAASHFVTKNPFRFATVAGSDDEPISRDVRTQRARVVFLFPGQGTQFVGMAKQFYDAVPSFRRNFETLLQFVPETSFSEQIRSLLLDVSANKELLNETKFTQVVLFVFEVALGRALLESGVVPCAVGGHSVGEIAAKTVVGELSIRDGMMLVITRANEMSHFGHGKMAAVLLTEKDLRIKLAEWNSKIFVSAINGRSSCVVSGEGEHISRFVTHCKENQIKVLILPNAHAFHSSMMSGAKEGVVKMLSSTHLYPSDIPVVSNLTGQWSIPQDMQFYIDQIDHPVLWDACSDNLLSCLRDEPNASKYCLEVGPGSVLGNLIKSKQSAENEIALRSCCPPNDSITSFFQAMRDLYVSVVPFSPSALFSFGSGWDSGRRVTITGTTSFLGIHVLEQFIKNTVCTIIVPLKAQNNSQKMLMIEDACSKYGVASLDSGEVRSRVVFVDTDDFDDDSTDVIHVTTSTNSLADYEAVKEANVTWATALAERCIASGATLHYVSSMGVLWGIENGDEHTLPPIEKAWMARHAGYTQSKIVMEHRLKALASKKGLNYCTYRVDMLGGSSVTGAVGPNSYYTSLLRTILRTKKCSTYMFGPTPRITVDEAAAQIFVLSGLTQRFPQTFHITSGKELFSMREFAVGFDTVPFEEFRQGLQSDTEQPLLSLIDMRADRHGQTPVLSQKTWEALTTANHVSMEVNSTRLAATVRRWLETHE